MVDKLSHQLVVKSLQNLNKQNIKPVFQNPVTLVITLSTKLVAE